MITYLQESGLFLLNTKHTTYAMAVGKNGLLCTRYWGPGLGAPEDVPTMEEMTQRKKVGAFCDGRAFQEYPGWGTGIPFVHAVKAAYGDGTRNVLLKYDSCQIDGETLTVTLSDPLGLRVELLYQVRPELDIIDKSARITNVSAAVVTLEQAMSASWRFPQTGAYRLTYLSGGWAMEDQVQREELLPGVKLLETKTGLSGPQAVPLFMLDEGTAGENQGIVYFGTLAWSGNFRFYVERTQFDDVTVCGGISDFDFSWPLKPGETFDTPVFTGGIASDGFSGASRLLHRYLSRYVLRACDADRLMPVILNSYGTFRGAINEEKILGLVSKAGQIGVEMLVIDAGWSGTGDNYVKGMGDWNINTERFPGGLASISEAVHQKGMKFGLWMEPEVVHVESRLYQEHPDWVLRYQGRPVSVVGNGRMILNFALDEVWQDILRKAIHLIDTCHLDYFKMDFNRPFQEMGSPLMPPEEQKTIGVRYVRNLYKFYHILADRYPDLLIENCASGGQRVDFGMMSFCGRINRSDNQDPLDILKIHEGFTYFMPSKFAGGGCNISKAYTYFVNERISPLRFQGTVAMMGSLAVGEDLMACTPEELNEIASLTARYKSLRHITARGDLYRLSSAREAPYAAFEFVLPDQSEAALFVFGQSMQFFCRRIPRLRLYGLDSSAKYEVEGYGIKTGAGLAHAGLSIPLKGDMDCVSVHIRKKT